jgi:hypothetical protein
VADDLRLRGAGGCGDPVDEAVELLCGLLDRAGDAVAVAEEWTQ